MNLFGKKLKKKKQRTEKTKNSQKNTNARKNEKRIATQNSYWTKKKKIIINKRNQWNSVYGLLHWLCQSTLFQFRFQLFIFVAIRFILLYYSRKKEYIEKKKQNKLITAFFVDSAIRKFVGLCEKPKKKNWNEMKCVFMYIPSGIHKYYYDWIYVNTSTCAKECTMKGQCFFCHHPTNMERKEEWNPKQ